MTITAAADGSALGNPGPAGWAWYVDDNRWGAGGWKHATNNQGELKAVLELFRATAHLDEDLLVLCDSQYVINSVTKWMPGWKAKGWRKSDGAPVLNQDLLKELDAELSGRRYRFEWVKGHANHPLNEAADVRARSVAEAYQRGSTVPAGPGWPGRLSNSSAPGLLEAEAQPAPSRRTQTPASQSQLSFFDEPSIAASTGAITQVEIATADFERLAERARRRGVTVQQLLHDLI